MTYNDANDLGGFFLDHCQDCTAEPWKREEPALDDNGFAPDAYFAAGWFLLITAPDSRFVRIGEAVEHGADGRIVPPGIMAQLVAVQKKRGDNAHGHV
jgi:hypothetical protein